MDKDHTIKNPFVVEFGSPENNKTNQRESNMTLSNEKEVTNYIPEESSNVETNTLSDNSTKGVYTKLETVVSFEKDDGKVTLNGMLSNGSINYPIDDSILEAFLVFINSGFNIFFTLGIAYWHESQGKTYQAYASLIILLISSLIIQIVFAFNREIKKGKIWDTSKVFAIFTIVPGSLTIILSFADFLFAIKEVHNRSFIRPWKGTRILYLVESLLLVFPQCVLQGVILMENPNSIPNIKGLFVLFAMGCMTMGMALCRIRFDSALRPDRFGVGIDKILRSAIVWGNKGLWVTTYTLLVVSVRIYYQEDPSSTLWALLALSLIYEIPIHFSSIQSLRKCIGKISGMFFLIPQFVSLFVLILWVNLDESVYITNIGICALGSFSWFVSLTIIGWLLDGCNDREMDILPIYPHFFGDITVSKCCK